MPSGTQTKGSAALRKQIEKQRVNFFQSFKRGDSKAIADLAVDDYVFVDERGASLRSAECFENLRETVSNPDPTADFAVKIRSPKFDDVSTRVFGDTAIESLIYSDSVSVKRDSAAKAEGFNRSFRVTNVWVRQDDAWKLASTQLTPMQAV